MGIGRNIDHERLDDLRRGRGPVQEHVIDEFVAGRLSRRDFIRRGSAIGLSMPLIGGILAACGSSGRIDVRLQPRPRRARLVRPSRSGSSVARGRDQPDHHRRPGRPGAASVNVGEFLVFTDHHVHYHPWLATSWSANSDASVWTFKIRQGVKFNDGTPMTVDDVVYSFKSQSDPKSSANALSVFGGTLSPDGVQKVDNHDGRLPPRRAEQRLRGRGVRGQLQHDHRARTAMTTAITRRSSPAPAGS